MQEAISLTGWPRLSDYALATSIGRVVRFLALYPEPRDIAAFDRHYFEIHVPLVKRLPGLRRYAVSRNPSSLRGPGYHLVAALDWDELAALQKDFASPTGEEVGRDAGLLQALCPGMSTQILELQDV